MNKKSKKAKYSAQDIFYWFMSENFSMSCGTSIFDNELFTYNKIILLMYFTQCMYLNKYNRPLFKGKIKEYKYIPIIEGISEKYKKIGSVQEYDNIRENDEEWKIWVEERSEKNRKNIDSFLEDIYWNFGQFDTWMLIKMYQRDQGKIKEEKKIRKEKLKKNGRNIVSILVEEELYEK